MGIDGLWEFLPPSHENLSLHDIAVQRGFNVNQDGQRTYTIGIDASMWFYHSKTVSGTAQNPELLMFFHRCCRLLSAPIRPLFVFDGPGRPKTKRNRERKNPDNSQLNGMRELIHAFGFECLTAPGEAEAALAQLNKLGVIDAILSDDSDCFLFGAKTVIRNAKVNSSKYMERVIIHDIATLEESAFTHEELILVALLRGGDYDPGIDGCGIKTAVSLRHLGLRQSLIQHWHTYACEGSLEQWNAFLCGWRTELRQELLMNGSRAAQANNKAASNITGDFPSSKVLSLYTSPVVFSDQEIEYISKNLWKTPFRLSDLAIACAKYFQWSTESAVLEKFERLVWPGAMMHQLLEAVRTIDLQLPVTLLPIEIIPSRKRKYDEIEKDMGGITIRFPTATFNAETLSGIHDSFPIYSDTITIPGKPALVEALSSVHPIKRKGLSTMRIHRSILEPLEPHVSSLEASAVLPQQPEQQLDIICISSDSDEEKALVHRQGDNLSRGKHEITQFAEAEPHQHNQTEKMK